MFTLHFSGILELRVPVTPVESVAKCLDCALLISAEGRDRAGVVVVVAGCARVRSPLCMCLFTKTHSSFMLTMAALKPGGSLSHRAKQASHSVRE